MRIGPRFLGCALLLSGVSCTSTPPAGPPLIAVPARALTVGQPRALAADETRLRSLRQLTFDGVDGAVRWAPTGTALVYVATRSPADCAQAYELDLSTGRERRLGPAGRSAAGADYLLGGRALVLALTSCPPAAMPPACDLVQLGPDGTIGPPLAAARSSVSVCPITGRVLFGSTGSDGDGLELYSTEPDGSDAQQLTHRPGPDSDAVFSPDGVHIALRTAPAEIAVMARDGTGLRLVTTGGHDNRTPCFGPEGQSIVFARDGDLYRTDLAGHGAERVTIATGDDRDPAFSPDGHWLAFTSARHAERAGQRNLFVAEWLP